MPTNVIKVTACDNELVVLACQTSGSVELFRILSGNSNPVAVTMTIQPGQYKGPVTLNGINGPLSANLTVNLDPGTYNLAVVGVNWGGPQQFTVAVNGTQQALPYSTPPQAFPGVVWSPTFPAITV